MGGHREARNRDRFNKKNYPIQTYAITGHEHGKVTGTSAGGQGAGKNLIDGPPMVITPTPPGSYAYDDDAWGATFGASMDSNMTLFPIAKVMPLQATALGTLQGEGQVFADAVPHADNLALYKDVLGKQQVKFLVSDDVATSKGLDKVSDYSKVRSIAMRGPMQYGGWGKTIGLRTTDSDPGDFRKADDEHKLDMATWRYGPVDLRWDDVRKVWRGFNDLIADMPDGEKNEGTLVFSTNPDATCGFPYLKGKLEDVWWVRKTCDEAGVFGSENDRLKSGSVCTHLEHKWFDRETNCYAPMNSIFLIHRDPECPQTCGAETTSKCPAIELYHDVYFHCKSNPSFHGPINFDCQEEPDDCELEQAGRMVFTGGVWSPAIDIDVCSNCIGASQFAITFSNDLALAKKICEVCQLVLKLHGHAKDKPKPAQQGGAAAAAGKAAGSAADAGAAFGDIPDTNNEILNDAKDNAAEAYDASAAAQSASQAAQNTAATDQSAANDAQAGLDAATEASDAAAAELNSNFRPDGTPKPGHTQEIKNDTADLAEADAAEGAAKDARDAAQQKADKSKQASDDAREAADAAGDEAAETHEEWKKEKAKDGSEMTDAEKAADAAAEQADKDAADAKQAGKDANETPESAEDCCKKNAAAIADLITALGGFDGIANLAGGNVATPGDVDEAIDAAEQKANDAIQNAVAAVDAAIASAIDSVNVQLGELGASDATVVAVDTTGTAIGQNAGTGEAGTGDGGANTGEGDPPGEDPPTKPPKVPPETSAPDPTGTGSVVKPDPTKPPTGTTSVPPPGSTTGGGTTETGDPVTSTPPPEKPETESPDCGVIAITDPCSGKTKVISCKGAGGTDSDGPTGPDTTTPTGESTSGSDPGTGDGKPGLHGDPSGGTGLGLGSTGGGWFF